MRLVIRLFAVLRERAGTDELRLDALPEGLDVGALKAELARRHPELGSLASVRGVVGTRYVDDAAVLAEGDEVSLLPPVSGGSGGSGGPGGPGGPGDDHALLLRGIFELCAAPLDPESCRRRVEHPSCGATVVFTGSTRDENRGRSVERLAYEAFEAMTEPEMARIFERCRERFADVPLRMVCQHRTGVVEVGEPSVVVAVAGPHRDAAFAACRFLIDELKASLPVWKKEFYPDGEHWIGDRS